MEPRTPRSDPVTTAGRVGPVRPDVFGEGPAVIGHRGLGCGVVAGHRQNTLSSFAAAVRSGARCVEADVRRLGDDVLVVAHDAAYPDGTRLADITGAEADRRGTLRLSALLDELPRQVGLNLDLKSSMDDCLRSPERTTAGLLAPVVATRRPLLVSSFAPAALWLLRATARRVPLGLLTWHRFPRGHGHRGLRPHGRGGAGTLRRLTRGGDCRVTRSTRGPWRDCCHGSTAAAGNCWSGARRSRWPGCWCPR